MIIMQKRKKSKPKPKKILKSARKYCRFLKTYDIIKKKTAGGYENLA